MSAASITLKLETHKKNENGLNVTFGERDLPFEKFADLKDRAAKGFTIRIENLRGHTVFAMTIGKDGAPIEHWANKDGTCSYTFVNGHSEGTEIVIGAIPVADVAKSARIFMSGRKRGHGGDVQVSGTKGTSG